MKKIILIAMFSIFAPSLLTAQKHAPRPSNQQKITPGIYPEGSTRYLNENDLEGLDSWDLKVFRNEIFARHGYIFTTRDMIDYFRGQKWYRPRYKDVKSLLSAVEKKNINLIKSYE